MDFSQACRDFKEITKYEDSLTMVVMVVSATIYISLRERTGRCVVVV